MDELSLRVLYAEMRQDATVVQDAAATARARYGQGSAPELEAASFHLARLYNAIEQLGTRVAAAFENTIHDRRGWHSELLRRLSLDVPGVRPPLWSASLLADLGELRSFRHVVRHAYDLTLRPDRVRELLDAAERVAAQLPHAIQAFVETVERDQGWSVDP